MSTGDPHDTEGLSRQARSGGSYMAKRLMGQTSLITVSLIVVCIAILSPSSLRATPQEAEEVAGGPQDTSKDQPTARVVGIKYNCVHVLKLEKTLKLYREILGFKMVDAEILHGEGIEGMLVMKLQANDCTVHLSLPAPEYINTVGPIGNTIHNHFMLLVNDIIPSCDKLIQLGYALENEAYARDKYSFFTGPNGEIVGLTETR